MLSLIDKIYKAQGNPIGLSREELERLQPYVSALPKVYPDLALFRAVLDIFPSDQVTKILTDSLKFSTDLDFEPDGFNPPDPKIQMAIANLGEEIISRGGDKGKGLLSEILRSDDFSLFSGAQEWGNYYEDLIQLARKTDDSTLLLDMLRSHRDLREYFKEILDRPGYETVIAWIQEIANTGDLNTLGDTLNDCAGNDAVTYLFFGGPAPTPQDRGARKKKLLDPSTALADIKGIYEKHLKDADRPLKLNLDIYTGDETPRAGEDVVQQSKKSFSLEDGKEEPIEQEGFVDEYEEESLGSNPAVYSALKPLLGIALELERDRWDFKKKFSRPYDHDYTSKYTRVLATLFKNTADAMHFVDAWGGPPTPIHDACWKLKLPSEGAWTSEFWAGLLNEHGPEKLEKYLPQAAVIEAEIAGENWKALKNRTWQEIPEEERSQILTQALLPHPLDKLEKLLGNAVKAPTPAPGSGNKPEGLV